MPIAPTECGQSAPKGPTAPKTAPRATVPLMNADFGVFSTGKPPKALMDLHLERPSEQLAGTPAVDPEGIPLTTESVRMMWEAFQRERRREAAQLSPAQRATERSARPTDRAGGSRRYLPY